ncbi:diguanylate cyclase domain-containing protein [Roseateles sp.]|jgi:diguanylate cyclase (GGDEF)-like protein/PAS domain S-box-containing protein|uniref:sensor domain-containing diguanylate cyclase n=1 Tax=Roseateles sp. TaxID=1971397 RepID=UPI0037C79413
MTPQAVLAKVLYWRGLPVLVLALALGLTLIYWRHERELDRLHLQSSFEASQREASLRIEQSMAAYTHLLQGVQSFVQAAAPQGASPRALQRYVDALPLGADFAGIQGVLRVDWLSHARRNSAGLVVQARGDRSHYAVVTQAEPLVASTRAVLGLDLAGDPHAQRALELARDSGRMALSSRMDLAQLGLPSAQGFLMVMPLYDGELVPASVQARRESLRGWVALPVRIHELMSGLYGELPAGLALSLHDGQSEDDADLLYRAGKASDAWQVGQEYLHNGGQTWTLTVQAGREFALRQGATGANAVLAAGAGFALLLALLAWLLSTARERAQNLAERMTRALRESEQRWAFALEGAGDGVWDWQVRGSMLSTSARWKSIMGLRPGQGEPSMSQMLACTHADDMPRLHSEIQRCLDGSASQLVSEYRVADDSGGWRWVLARGTVIERDAQGLPLRMIGTLSDISVRRESEERVRFMALHDPLTELANRAHFDERLHFALANARRYNESIGLILLDLDRFKPVNDQHGHAVGDALLQAVARRIRNSVRETDTVGRIGGDEFVVLLTGPVTRDSAQVVADKIFNQVAMPLELGGLQLEITCSLGLALYPEDGVDELSLTKAADDAMYRNKRAGREAMSEARTGQDPSATRPGDLSGR